MYKVRGQDDEIVNVSWCPQYEVTIRKSLTKSVKKSNSSEKPDDGEKDEKVAINLDSSALTKSLPEDSFCDAQEDDLFDMYKDHQDDEFGHKKFEPKDIVVKVKKEEEKGEYLEDCSKLKDKMIKNKKESDASIASLVDAFDKTSIQKIDGDKNKVEKEGTTTAAAATTTITVAAITTTTPDDTIPSPPSTPSTPTPPSTPPPTNTTPPKPATTTTTTAALNDDEEETKVLGDISLHTHTHLLASIGKYG